MSLGSILVRLSMNTADFETDAGRAAKVAQRRAKEIDQAFKKLGVGIGLALGAAVSGAAVAIKSTIDRMDEMSKAAQKVGLPTEDFSRLTYAAGLADVSMDTLVGSLGKLTKSQAAALKSTSEQAKVFQALGIDAIDPLTKKLRDSGDVLMDFADAFKEQQGSPEIMAAGFALFGRSFQELIPLLKDGASGLRSAGEEADALGVTLSTSAGQQAEAFNDNLTRLKAAVQGMALAVASDLLPEMVNLTNSMVDFAKDGERSADVANKISNAFEAAGAVLGGVGAGFSVIGNAVEGLTEGMMGLYQVAAGLVTLDWSRIRAGMKVAQEGADVAYYGADKKGGSAPSFADVRGGASSKLTLEGEVAAERARRAHAAALHKALGDPDPKGKRTVGARAPRAAKAGKSDEQKASEELEAAYKREVASLHEKLYMIENVGEAASLNYELESGSLKALDEPRAKVLRDLQAQSEAAKKLADQQESGKRLMDQYRTDEEQSAAAIEEATQLLSVKAITQETLNRVIADNQAPAQKMLASIDEEIKLLGMSIEQQEIYNNLKRAGVEANSEFGKSIVEGTKDLQALRDQVAFMDDIKAGLSDMFVDFVSGAKSAKEAFGDFADQLFKRALQFVADKAIQAMFDAFSGKSSSGSSSSSSSSGWAGLFSGIAGAFGGSFAPGGSGMGSGWAMGGYTGSGGVNQPAGIVHRGEIVWSQTDVARAGGVGKVESMRAGGAGVPQVNNFHFAAPTDLRTQQQVASRAGFEQQRALARTR